jgi:hypothetical protein
MAQYWVVTSFGPPSATDRFATILEGCGKALGLAFHTKGLSAPLYWLIWRRMQGAIRRFIWLACRVREGMLKPPRPRAAPRPDGEPARERKPDKLPRGRRGWVVHLGGHHVAAFASQLEHFLTHDAEVARMMAADPYRMRRILRPLCHMLGKPLPEALCSLPRKRPAAAAAAPPQAAALTPSAPPPPAPWPASPPSWPGSAAPTAPSAPSPPSGLGSVGPNPAACDEAPFFSA